MATGSVEASISADEIIAAGRTVELVFAAPVDPRSAQGAVRVLRDGRPVDARIQVAKRGRVVRVALGASAVGAFALVISELLSSKGETLVDRYRLPFSIVPMAGAVPADHRIEHAARLRIDELAAVRLAPGQVGAAGHVDVIKAVHRTEGTPVELAFDEKGERVDLAQRLADLAKRRDARFGRIHETLYDRMQQAKETDVIPIVVWPRLELPPAPYEKPADRRSEEPPDAEAKLAGRIRRQVDALIEAVRRVGVKPADDRRDDGVPAVRATATVEQIQTLAKDPAVGAILFDDPTATTDLGTSIAIARSDRVHLAGFDGTGIRVAVWEDGPSDTSDLTFAGRFTTTPAASGHARLTSGIVRNTQPNRPHGHAPDCDLYSANTFGTDALRWAVRDQRCTVVSQSFHRNSEASGSGLQADDLLKDWLALRWPYPTILQASGNFWQGDSDAISPPENEFVNHKGFNSLAIGNHNDAATAMSGDSVFRNPASTHGDRELPELAANGTGVSAVSENRSGTSFAAPATAGVTALLQDADGVLCSWPEGCRAILFASAGRNVRGSTWWQDVQSRTDARDGAGAVDAEAGLAITRQRRWRDAPATRHGWDVGTLSSGAIGPDRLATFRYRVAVPAILLFPTVKVALAWDSAVTSSGDTATASTLTVDLDLLVRDGAGGLVGLSASWDNSYEVVEFAATPGASYEIVIRRWSGTDSVWYGVAWTVTGFSFAVPFRDLDLFSSISFG